MSAYFLLIAAGKNIFWGLHGKPGNHILRGIMSCLHTTGYFKRSWFRCFLKVLAIWIKIVPKNQKLSVKDDNYESFNFVRITAIMKLIFLILTEEAAASET